MKRVGLSIRSTTSRVPFRSGSYEARLEEVDVDGIPTGPTVFTTRNHETWSSAASAALKKADRMAWDVSHRGLILQRIAENK